MLSGIINLDKPSGLTSHDVVDAVRRMAGQRRVGHAGTLDPMATGVLLVCLGLGTRVSEFLMEGRKRYRAGIVLGASTDTYDADGHVTACGGCTDFSRQEIEDALRRFVGRIEQVPPAFSAVKQKGEPSYRRARRGESVELKPRTVEIDHLSVLSWAQPGAGQISPLLTVEVSCSPGTYIRSLAHDLGQALGCGAYLSTLVRLRSGRFCLEDSVSLDRLQEAFREGDEARFLLPVDEALLDWPALIAAREDAQRILQGLPIVAQSGPGPGGEQAAGRSRRPRCRAYNLEGEFLAILAYHAEQAEWWPDKVFVPAGCDSCAASAGSSLLAVATGETEME